jgi:hypothetical protein
VRPFFGTIDSVVQRSEFPVLPVYLTDLGKRFDCATGRLSATVDNGSKETDIGQALGSGKYDESQIRVLSWKPRVFHYPGFLSEAEADRLIELGTNKSIRHENGCPIQTAAI